MRIYILIMGITASNNYLPGCFASTSWTSCTSASSSSFWASSSCLNLSNWPASKRRSSPARWVAGRWPHLPAATRKADAIRRGPSTGSWSEGVPLGRRRTLRGSTAVRHEAPSARPGRCSSHFLQFSNWDNDLDPAVVWERSNGLSNYGHVYCSPCSSSSSELAMNAEECRPSSSVSSDSSSLWQSMDIIVVLSTFGRIRRERMNETYPSADASMETNSHLSARTAAPLGKKRHLFMDWCSVVAVISILIG